MVNPELATEATTRIKRMRALASHYHGTSEFLAGKVDPKVDFGPAQTQLSILAFEILLKSIHLAELGKNGKFSHSYRCIWKEISLATREETIEVASHRFAGHVNYAKIGVFLDAWSRAFTRGRYSYEKLDGETESEASERGANWIADGANPEEADFAFYPMELDGLIIGINDWLDRNTTTNSL